MLLPVPVHITVEWISGDSDQKMTWSGSNNESMTLLQASLVSPTPYEIIGETCQDGTVYYVAKNVCGQLHCFLPFVGADHASNRIRQLAGK